MYRFMVAVTALLVSAGSAGAAITSTETARLTGAARAIDQIRNEIPQEYWTRARCVVAIAQLKKAALIFGGEYGKGVMSCRAGDQWSAPVFMQLAKGSWGFQAGVEQADVVLLVMNDQGVQKLLSNKVNLGADASVAAGPLGRRGGVATDAAMTAEILSYSRSQGLFAGIDISGGVLRPDEDANANVYGPGASPRTILASREISAPTQAASFLSALRGSSAPATTARPGAAAATPPTPRTTTLSTIDDDLRARVVDIQQSIDRILADTTPAPVGTSGTLGASSDTPSSRTVTIDRARLLQLRQQVEALIAALNRR